MHSIAVCIYQWRALVHFLCPSIALELELIEVSNLQSLLGACGLPGVPRTSGIIAPETNSRENSTAFSDHTTSAHNSRTLRHAALTLCHNLVLERAAAVRHRRIGQ